MSFLPFALSLSNTFTKIGAVAAFAALVGIAVLSLLVFSQARELKRLREWAGRAPERAAELEQRVTAAAAIRAQRQAPAPAPARPVPPAAPAPTAAAVPTAAAATGAGPATRVVGAPVPPLPGTAPVPAVPGVGTAPGGVPAPAVAQVAQPAAASVPAPVLQPASAAGVAQNRSLAASAQSTAPPEQRSPAAPAPATAAAAAGISAPTAPRAPSPPSPEPAAIAPAPAPGQGLVAPRLPPPPPPPPGSARKAPAGPVRPARSDAAFAVRRPPGAASPGLEGRSVYTAPRSRRRMVALVTGFTLATAAVAAVAVSALGGSSSSKPASTPAQTVASRTPARAKRHSRAVRPKQASAAPAVSPAETTVAVLNATEAEGLAHRTASALQQNGYSQATALNGRPPGSGQVSVVEYVGGHQAEAEGVAHSLSVTHVLPIEAAVSALTGHAFVVVIVGADIATQIP